MAVTYEPALLIVEVRTSDQCGGSSDVCGPARPQSLPKHSENHDNIQHLSTACEPTYSRGSDSSNILERTIVHQSVQFPAMAENSGKDNLPSCVEIPLKTSMRNMTRQMYRESPAELQIITGGKEEVRCMTHPSLDVRPERASISRVGPHLRPGRQ